MPIPDYQSVMLPLLEALNDDQEHIIRDVTAALADRFRLTEAERHEMLPSGQQTVFSNRVAWAKTYLKSAGLIDNPNRGRIRLSPSGREVLNQHPARVDSRFLRRFPSFLEFIGQSEEGGEALPAGPGVESQRTPLELLESSYATMRNATAEDLLSRLKNCSPTFFEHIVVQLLHAMGYGGFADDAAVVGRPGDAGIDGVIKEDKLGLDVVCVQAKRWEATVGRPVIQGFAGSMDFYRARKGVIITTSNYSREAMDFVKLIEGKKVVLIDGPRLAELMIEHNVGVTLTKTYELKEVSNDFFDEDEG